MYDKGSGVETSPEKAFELYEQAAKQNHAAAQHKLGVMYETGKGVPENLEQAAKWYQKAAEQNLAPAQFNLGSKYLEGLGVDKDFIAAHVWYSLAARKFREGEERDLAVKFRKFVEKQMSSEQLAESQKRLKNWKPKQNPN